MLQTVKQRLKPILLFTVVPMLIFDVVFFVVYNLCNEWTNIAIVATNSDNDLNGILLPALLSPIDMPHRMFITPILVLIVSAAIILYFTNFKTYKNIGSSSCIANIKAISVFKVLAVACMFYFTWYSTISPMYGGDTFPAALDMMESLFNIYSPIIMVICYILVFLATFTSKND